jgi:hypothetical protein
MRGCRARHVEPERGRLRLRPEVPGQRPDRRLLGSSGVGNPPDQRLLGTML